MPKVLFSLIVLTTITACKLKKDEDKNLSYAKFQMYVSTYKDTFITNLTNERVLPIECDLQLRRSSKRGNVEIFYLYFYHKDTLNTCFTPIDGITLYLDSIATSNYHNFIPDPMTNQELIDWKKRSNKNDSVFAAYLKVNKNLAVDWLRDYYEESNE